MKGRKQRKGQAPILTIHDSVNASITGSKKVGVCMCIKTGWANSKRKGVERERERERGEILMVMGLLGILILI